MKKTEFVAVLWPHLRPAIAGGFHPGAILAQIALETAWLDKVNRFPGTAFTSFNLFNITAGKSWTGKTCQVPTREFLDGKWVRMTRPFRAYGSYEESIEDYLRLISTAKRYANAYASRGDLEGYARGLQAGSFATDPAYATKIIVTARALPPLPGEEEDHAGH